MRLASQLARRSRFNCQNALHSALHLSFIPTPTMSGYGVYNGASSVAGKSYHSRPSDVLHALVASRSTSSSLAQSLSIANSAAPYTLAASAAGSAAAAAALAHARAVVASAAYPHNFNVTTNVNATDSNNVSSVDDILLPLGLSSLAPSTADHHTTYSSNTSIAGTTAALVARLAATEDRAAALASALSEAQSALRSGASGVTLKRRSYS